MPRSVINVKGKEREIRVSDWRTYVALKRDRFIDREGEDDVAAGLERFDERIEVLLLGHPGALLSVSLAPP